MANNKEKILMCPGCFCKEKDLVMSYDEQDDIYYCRKCCYEGTEEQIRSFYKEFVERKYPDMATKYDGNVEDNYGLWKKKN